MREGRSFKRLNRFKRVKGVKGMKDKLRRPFSLATSILTSLLMSIGMVASVQAFDTGIDLSGQSQKGGVGCYDGKVFSAKMINGICWDCIFPLVISKATMGQKSKMPDGAAEGNVLGTCMCSGGRGGNWYGVRTSFWEPFRMVELERVSGCASALGGIRFPFSRLHQGSQGSLTSWVQDKSGNARTYRHFHIYSYPIMYLLNMFVPSHCNPGGYVDFDIMYLSEVDPTWNNDEIAFFTHPEAALIASPLGAISCIPDAFGANIGRPIKELFWCAGSWGVIFPTTGNALSSQGIMQSSSLLATRALYALHRRALEWRSIGDDAMCGGKLSPYLPKNQYRMEAFHPIAETESNHVIGESIYQWGLGRTIPAVGEDPIFILWRWLDCCNTMG